MNPSDPSPSCSRSLSRLTESSDGPVEYAESYERPDLLATFITVAPEDDSADSVLEYEV